jgi:hypothetical protein
MSTKALAGVAAGLAALTLGAGIASAQSDDDTDPTVTEQQAPTTTESTPEDTTPAPPTPNQSTPDQSKPDQSTRSDRPDGC